MCVGVPDVRDNVIFFDRGSRLHSIYRYISDVLLITRTWNDLLLLVFWLVPPIVVIISSLVVIILSLIVIILPSVIIISPLVVVVALPLIISRFLIIRVTIVWSVYGAISFEVADTSTIPTVRFIWTYELKCPWP